MWPFSPRHLHDWKYLTVVHYFDTSYGLRQASFMGARQCRTCGELEPYSVWAGGHPTLEDLNSRDPSKDTSP